MTIKRREKLPNEIGHIKVTRHQNLTAALSTTKSGTRPKQSLKTVRSNTQLGIGKLKIDSPNKIKNTDRLNQNLTFD